MDGPFKKQKIQAFCSGHLYQTDLMHIALLRNIVHTRERDTI